MEFLNEHHTLMNGFFPIHSSCYCSCGAFQSQSLSDLPPGDLTKPDFFTSVLREGNAASKSFMHGHFKTVWTIVIPQPKCLIIGYSHTAVMPAIRVRSNGFPAVTAALCKLHNKMMKSLCAAAVVMVYDTTMDPACLHELVSSQDGRQLACFQRKQLGIKASTLTLCVETRFQPKHSLRVYSHSAPIYLAWKTITPSLRSPLSPSFFILLFASLLSFLPPVYTHFFQHQKHWKN